MIERTAGIQQVEHIDKTIHKGSGVISVNRHRSTKRSDLDGVRVSSGEGKKDSDVTLKEAVEKLNKTLEIFNVERRFVIDDKTKEVVVKIIDKETGEVIDQIPPEEALERYYEMQRFIGLIFNKRV